RRANILCNLPFKLSALLCRLVEFTTRYQVFLLLQVTIKLLSRFAHSPNRERRVCQPVRMRTEQHRVQTRKRSARPDPQHERNRNNSRLPRIFLDPVACFDQSSCRRSRGACEPRTSSVNLRRAIVVSFRVVKNPLARVARNVAHSLSSTLHVFYRLSRSAAGTFADFIFVSQPFSFFAQTFRATGDCLSTFPRRFTGCSCAFTNQIRNRILLVELAGLAARRLLPLVQLFPVISH